MLKKISDRELIKTLEIDAKTLAVFKDIQKQTIKEAEMLAENMIIAIKISRAGRASEWKYDYRSN